MGVVRRLRVLSRLSAGASAAPAPQLVEVQLGDTADRWEAVGFHPITQDEGPAAVALGNVTVLLSGSGAGLESLGFSGISAEAAAAVSSRMPDGVAVHAATPPNATGVATLPPNTVSALAELVLFARDLPGFVGALAEGGILTEKGYPPRPMKGTLFANARFFLQPQLRVLVVGPESPEAAEESVLASAAAAPGPMRWMFGSRGEDAALGLKTSDVEVAGWMAV